MAKPTAELQQLRMFAKTWPNTVYGKIVDEVLAYEFMVTKWTEVPKGGSAIACFGPFGAEWQINYQSGNLANIVHELTHIACYLGYDNDFLCWPRTTRVKPERIYSRPGEQGYILNQETLQSPEMSMLEPLLSHLQTIRACVAGAGLSKEKAAKILERIAYSMTAYGGVEFDPVVNNILGYLVEWGYPKKPGFFGASNNTLFETVQRVALEQHNKRKPKR